MSTEAEHPVHTTNTFFITLAVGLFVRVPFSHIAWVSTQPIS